MAWATSAHAGGSAANLGFGYNSGGFSFGFNFGASQFASRGSFFGGNFGSFSTVSTFSPFTGNRFWIGNGVNSVAFQPFNRFLGQGFFGFGRGFFGYPAFSCGYGYPFGLGRYGTYPLFAGYSGAPFYPVNRLFYGLGQYGVGLPDGVDLPIWGPRYGLAFGDGVADGAPAGPLPPAGPEDMQDFAEMPDLPFGGWFDAAPPQLPLPEIGLPAQTPPAFGVPALPLGNRPPPAIPVPGFTP